MSEVHERSSRTSPPYVLGALEESEARELERHIEGCAHCRAERDRLRLAADALPRSVLQVEPPPSLKASLMAEVEGSAAPAPRRSRLRGLIPDLGGMRPGSGLGERGLPAGGRDRRRLGHHPARRTTTGRASSPQRSTRVNCRSPAPTWWCPTTPAAAPSCASAGCRPCRATGLPAVARAGRRDGPAARSSAWARAGPAAPGCARSTTRTPCS